MRQETSIINMSMFSAYEDLLNHSKWSEIFKLLCVSNPMGEWDLVLFQTSFFEFLNKKLIIVAHFSVLSKPNFSKKKIVTHSILLGMGIWMKMLCAYVSSSQILRHLSVWLLSVGRRYVFTDWLICGAIVRRISRNLLTALTLAVQILLQLHLLDFFFFWKSALIVLSKEKTKQIYIYLNSILIK